MVEDSTGTNSSGTWLVRTGFFSQVRGMIAALLASRQRDTLFLLGVGLIAIVGATAHAKVRLNACNEPFYDALAHKNFPKFVQQSIVFAELAGILLALNVAQIWLNQKSKLVLRESLVEDLPAGMAIAAARLSSVTCPRDRRQARSTDS
jgi:ABC-type uncharacterized transport system fused permease/ATPase subunit